MDSGSSQSISGTFAQRAFDALRPLIDFVRESADWKVKNGINYTLRKLAHMTTYFFLAVFIILGLRGFLKNKLLILVGTVVAVLTIAILDEVHQTFVSGRNASVVDVAIDMAGALLVFPCLFLRRLGKAILRWLKRDWVE